MAIPGKKLGAFMEAQDAAEYEDAEMPELEESEEMEESEESDESEALEAFLKLLMEHGSQLETAAHQVELFSGEEELDDDTKEQIEATLADMPEELTAGLGKFFGTLSMDELHELVEQLEEMDAIENDAVVVPYLFHAARLVAAK